MDKKLENINLKDIPELVPIQVLQCLNAVGITDVESAIRAAKRKVFIDLLPFSKNAINMTRGTIRILRCKFLQEDPLIEENDELTSDEIGIKFGFSSRIVKALELYSNNSPDWMGFFKTMRSKDCRLLLSQIRGLGEVAIQEMMAKTKVVFDYYDERKNKQSHELTIDEELKKLQEDLHRLNEERKRIDDEIDVVLKRTEELINASRKGGIRR